MKNKKIYILAICLTVILTGCSLSLVKKVNTPEINPEVKKEPIVNSVATTSKKIATSTEDYVSLSSYGSSTVNMDNWRVYINEKYGFELKLPLSYLVEEEGDGQIRFYHPSMDMMYKPSEKKYTKIEGGEFYLQPTKKSFKEYLEEVKKNNPPPYFTEEKNIKYDNVDGGFIAWLWFEPAEEGVDGYEIFIEGKKEYNFILTEGWSSFRRINEKAIVSSFKFIK